MFVKYKIKLGNTTVIKGTFDLIHRDENSSYIKERLTTHLCASGLYLRNNIINVKLSSKRK